MAFAHRTHTAAIHFPPVFLCMPTMHTVHAPTIRRSKRQGFVRVSSSLLRLPLVLSLGPQSYLPLHPLLVTCYLLPACLTRLHADFRSMVF
jgi:hypothetical protein